MLHRRQRILHHKLDIQRRPDLMQHRPHGSRPGVREKHEFQLRGRLEVVQFVLGRAVGEEGVVLAAELSDETAEREDGAEDEFGVVGGFGLGAEGRGCCGGRGGGILLVQAKGTSWFQ